jgi:hypothetical protein
MGDGTRRRVTLDRDRAAANAPLSAAGPNTTHRLFAGPSVSDRLVLIDGISRVGKMLAAKVISAFERVDFFQYQPVLEHIPILWRLGILDLDSAAIFWRLNVDMAVLDRAAGRNLNTRTGDSTSVHNAPDVATYLARAEDPDFDELLRKFTEEKRLPAFLTHETLPHVALIFAARPETRLIEVERNPVDLAYSWFQRGWGTRFGTDATALIPVVAGEDGPVPWFAVNFKRALGCSYVEMSPADRCAASVLALRRENAAAMAKLTKTQAAHVHTIAYERVLTDPQAVLDGIGDFLQTRPHDGMDGILAREGLPGKGHGDGESRHAFLQDAVSKDLMAALDDAAATHAARHGA